MIYIPPGILFTMEVDTIYALPTRVCKLYTNTAFAILAQSNDETFTSSTPVTLVQGAYECGAAFIAASGQGAVDTLVFLKVK